MKLSEVIKAIEDGSKSKFTNGVYEITESSTFNYAIYVESIAGFHNTNLSKDGWEEVKPPRQWSEKELMLFKLLPDWAKWISKDGDDGSVFIFNEKPQKLNCVFKGEVGTKSDFVCQTGTIIDDFLTITFEESPIYIGDLKNV